MSKDAQHIQLECIRISDEGAAEMDGMRRLIFVPREEIQRIDLRHGSAAERPIITLVLGILLLGVALVALVLVAFALKNGRPFPTAFVTVTIFAWPGWWLLDLATRPRFFLHVQGRASSRKLVFHRTKDQRSIEEFLAIARSRFNYI